MLSYARTDEDVQPDGIYHMSDNQISVKTMKLDTSFEKVQTQLDEIAETQFAREAACV